MTESKQQPPYSLRLPDTLRRRLDESSEITGKTLRQEIIDRLWLSFGEPASTEDTGTDLFDEITEMKKRLTAIEAAIDALKGK